MESPTTSQHEELGKRIRSLTSILHKFNLHKPPTPHKEISAFLRHLTTFLTYDDTHVKRVVAVAGSIAPEQVRAVIVTQNPGPASLVQNIRLFIHRDSDLMRHIKEALRVLSTFDPLADSPTAHKSVLEVFFLTRSFRKFEARFREDRRLCGGQRLYEVITQWNPDPNIQELPHSWVSTPEWLLSFTRPVNIPSRYIEGQLQLEFSDETRRAWSGILAVMLIAVDDGIEEVKTAWDLMGQTAEGTKVALDDLNTAVCCLYSFISWKAGVVKSLLSQTTMLSSIATVWTRANRLFSQGDETDDDTRDLDQGVQETKGQQVFRYLQMVTAWHAAVNSFSSNRMFPELLKNIKVGLVEVPSSPASVLSLKEVCDEFFSRFPDMVEKREAVLREIKSRHSKQFSGCVHAQATLMGLLSYARSDLGQTSDAHGVGLEDSAMQHVVKPVAEVADPTIAVSQKCCWCCDWLGKNIGTDFILPGTHGIMFPWDPPKMGVSTSVLGSLEQELWQALRDVVSNVVDPLYSRHSTPMGSPGSPPDPEIELSYGSSMMQKFGGRAGLWV